MASKPRARSRAGRRKKTRSSTVAALYDPDAAYRAELDARLYVCKVMRGATRQHLAQQVEQAMRLVTAGMAVNSVTAARACAANNNNRGSVGDGFNGSCNSRNTIYDAEHVAHDRALVASTCLPASALSHVVRSLGFCMTNEQLEQLTAMTSCMVHIGNSDAATAHADADTSNNRDNNAKSGNSGGGAVDVGNTTAATTTSNACIDTERLVHVLSDVRHTGVLLYNPVTLPCPHACWPAPTCTRVHMAQDEAPLQACFVALWRACGCRYTRARAGEPAVRCLRVSDLRALLHTHQQTHPSLNTLASHELSELCFALVDGAVNDADDGGGDGDGGGGDCDDDTDGNKGVDDDVDGDRVVREDTFVHFLSNVY